MTVVLLVNFLLVMLGILLMKISNTLLRRHQEDHLLLIGMVIRNINFHGNFTLLIVYELFIHTYTIFADVATAL